MQNSKRIKKIILSLVALFIIATLAITFKSFYWANSDIVTASINRTTQNTLPWAHKVTFTPKPKIDNQLAKNYLKQYFYPWNIKNTQQSLEKVRCLELKVIEKRGNNPGWDENQHKHTKQWIQQIIENMNMANLSKTAHLNLKAIMVEDTDVRAMPTIKPSFGYWKDAGEGLPFDYLQESRFYTNTPVSILNIAKNKNWYLIKKAGVLGWVPSKTVFLANNQLIEQWEQSPYIIAIKNNRPIFDEASKYRSQTHLGILYPLVKSDKTDYTALIATPTANSYAQATLVKLPKQFTSNFPIPITPLNIAKIADNIVGQPYGWGNLYDYTDCSGMTKNLLASFGIWLPRNSSDQIKIGQQFSLAGLNNAQKEQLIIKKGIPFLTLIHKPGHIMLYIGHNQDNAYILHNLWGLKTKNLLGQEGRAVIGKAVITSLNLGHSYINVPTSLLSGVDEMSILYSPPLNTFDT